MSYPRPSLSKVMDDESHYQEFDDPLASDCSEFEEITIVKTDDLFSDDDSFFSLAYGSDFEEIAIVEADDIFSDDDSFFSLTSVENSKFKDMRRGWNNRASALGTDETIRIDAEKDLNLQEKELNTFNLTVFRKQIYHTTVLHSSTTWQRDLSNWSKYG